MKARLWQTVFCDANMEGANLQEAYLSSANLSNANLRHATLHGANLVGTNLTRACVSRAFLAGADLSNAVLAGADLAEASFEKANLTGANLQGSELRGANLSWCTLDRTNLDEASAANTRFNGARFLEATARRADFTGADFHRSDLNWADFSEAVLFGASLRKARLVEVNFTRAILDGCQVYGVSVWDSNLADTSQVGLVLNRNYDESAITVDSLDVAQFIYLLLDNRRIREVIDTIATKVVLVLGRFTPGRKAVLDVVADELRKLNYIPVVFDFAKPSSRTTVETILTLANLARFVIADLTDAKCVLQELQAIVPTHPCLPIQPIILALQREPGMFDFFRRYPWVLQPLEYTETAQITHSFAEMVLRRVDARARELNIGDRQTSWRDPPP
jgi:uncharacterized protein YjbI with pentapeptide repeats